MKQTKFQLKNKLNVLLVESKKSPVISVQMWVKTGSADEKKGEEGISHFIEHLVFKGTDKFKVGEIANTVEASGGELNAYTSFDQTVFYVTISKNFSDVALDVVSQMMGYPTFDPAEIDSEREVVCEEIKMGQDSPNRRSSQLMFSSAFKKHAYGLPVIGYDKNVRSWSTKKIKEFYQSRYVPSNMFLVVSGDFETPQMKQKVHEYFAGFKDYKLRKVKRVKEPAQKKYNFKAQKYKIQDQHLHFAFKAPNIRHADARDFLNELVGQLIAGEAVRGVGSHTDIHARRLAEEAMRASAEQHRLLFEALALGCAQDLAWVLQLAGGGDDVVELGLQGSGIGLGDLVDHRDIRGWREIVENCADRRDTHPGGEGDVVSHPAPTAGVVVNV